MTACVLKQFHIPVLMLISIMALSTNYVSSLSTAGAGATTTTTTNTNTNTRMPVPPSISVPVYSLATTFKQAPDQSQSLNFKQPSAMNIVTFATPVSVNPRLYMISLYHGTMTRDAFLSNKYAVLQLLDKKQKDLVPILGKRSGYEDIQKHQHEHEHNHNHKQGQQGQGQQGQGQRYDKQDECEKVGYPWTTLDVGGEHDWNGLLGAGDDVKKAFQGMKLLPKCQSYIQLEMMDTMEAGDHDMALCRVLGVGEWDTERDCVANVIQCNVDDNDDDDNGVTSMLAKAKDEETVLYTGYLRKMEVL